MTSPFSRREFLERGALLSAAAASLSATPAAADDTKPVSARRSANDRLRVAVHVCQASGATELAAHYNALLPAHDQPPSPALAALLQWAGTLTTDPRRGDRAALDTLKTAGLDDAAIVALAQLVAFLSYQTRVVAGLKALRADVEGVA
jgi:uncharacterized protein YciW